VKSPDVAILEIGTLFGTGAGIMYDALAPHFETVHMTLLDPLDGYYAAGRLDILTGQPVTEAVLVSNLKRAGLTDENYTIIKQFSTEHGAYVKASRRRYDVLVIDGDHSYAGVKSDFDIYAPLVKTGGFIIFDDYSSEDWPDVQDFVDKEVAPRAEFGRVGYEWRTSVYRVLKSVGSDAAMAEPDVAAGT